MAMGVPDRGFAASGMTRGPGRSPLSGKTLFLAPGFLTAWRFAGRGSGFARRRKGRG